MWKDQKYYTNVLFGAAHSYMIDGPVISLTDLLPSANHKTLVSNKVCVYKIFIFAF